MTDASNRTHYEPDRTSSGQLTRLMRKLRAVINGENVAPTVTPNWVYREARDKDFIFVPHISMSECSVKPATMQPSGEVGQFIREQIPPVELAPASPACRHAPLRSSETGYQPPNFGGVYDDECLHQTPVHWNYGHVTICHSKTVWPPERPPLTLWQWLLPWTRPKLTDTEKWMRKQLD